MINQSDDQLNTCAEYLFHLMGCALRGQRAIPKPNTISWQQVFSLSMRNSVQGLVWFGAKDQPDMPDDLRKRWQQEANRILYRRARFDLERQEVLAAMDKQGLSYLPLKGAVLADYYPRPEMRTMCDNDILYGYVEPCVAGGWQIRGTSEAQQDATTEQAVADMVALMEARDYHTESAYVGNHEMFLKAPFFNFEMHRNLASYDHPMHAYYANPWSRAIPDEPSAKSMSADDASADHLSSHPHAFHFSDEDAYIYVIVHAFKHFDYAGCGVRIFADIWAFYQTRGALMNWDYVRQQLEILGIADFEQRLRQMALDGLAGEVLSADQLELLHYMAGCGTYGTVAHRMQNAARKVSQQAAQQGESAGKVKARYLWQRMFGTGESFLKQNYPFFYKHKAARPLFPLYRIFRALTRNQASTLKEVKTILRSDRK